APPPGLAPPPGRPGEQREGGRAGAGGARGAPGASGNGRCLSGREWEEAQKLWVQEVSTAPSTRRDVVQLQEQLDRQLQQRQARETGLCPVRRELYTQCFDELIRQTTVSCAERGLLLLRVRDELQLTLSAYQALYESSVAFGVRKALQAEQGKAHLEKRVSHL
ncbi:IDLC protein, partial [Quiscalus mexicanus]|nr:IDLC protein [Quiscalus mexicanus]